MLMEETKERNGQEQIKTDDSIVYIRNDPVMQSAVDVLSLFGQKEKIVLRAKGNSIPNAVAVANIITEKMLKGNSKVEKIKLDTENEPGIGRMLSTIEIILNKI
ncbi:DNA-binding protein [Nitrosopumilus sp. K4]|uniref:DNA-binding protein n=1 Tax=Nitrosopumilus sp. K4 TaxID=2795383 RepID=UPI001BA4C8AB|nr:DNA-binding protein [Nitrosopumilus sp. K4]QUC65266.1 DNA-binding protein [Nitrosopumilus sp. K4]